MVGRFNIQRECAARSNVMIRFYERGPMRLVRRALIIMLVTATVIYGAICAALFAFQRSLIYYPQPRLNQAGITLMTLPVGADSVLVSTRPSAGPRRSYLLRWKRGRRLSRYAGLCRCISKRCDLSSPLSGLRRKLRQSDRAIYLRRRPVSVMTACMPSTRTS